MDTLRLTIDKGFKGAVKSFYRFPAAIASAITISIVAIVRIAIGYEVQMKYDFLFNSIQMAFLLGAVFSMAVVVFEEIKVDKKKSMFMIANLSGILLAIITFLLLYFLGGRIAEDKIVYLSSIAMARVNVAVFISAVGFVYAISKAKAIDSFSDSFFITHRAFIISAIYGLVVMIGVSGVLGAFQALVYRNMDSDIYQYLGVVVGFLTYTIFLGYFPSFRERENIDNIEAIKEQPKFIFVLLGYIIIPIMMALTVVLLIWTVRVMLKGVDVSFNRLSSIASSYVIIGIWLHIMVAKHQSKLAEFYKKAYPFAGILILIFEAWALYVQLSKFGLKTAEYSFLMIWIFAVISVLLLIFLKEESYRKIAIVAVAISTIWVLPFVGYEDITFNSQVKRLETLLIEQELLVNDSIVAGDEEIEYIKRGEITDAVDFISNSEKTNTPPWFNNKLYENDFFKDAFGFEKTYGLYSDPEEYMYSSYRLETGVIDISDYNLSLNMLIEEDFQSVHKFEGEKGIYEISLENESSGIPKIIVKFEDKIIIEKSMKDYVADLLIKYPIGENRERGLAFEDMSLILEGEDISILLIFSNINVDYSVSNEEQSYSFILHGAYVKYK